LKKYEILAIIKYGLSNTEYEENVALLKKWIEDLDGAILGVSDIGVKDLAETFRKHEKGYYILYQFEMNPANVIKLKGHLRISETFIRDIIVNLDSVHVLKGLETEPLEETLEEESSKQPVESVS